MLVRNPMNIHQISKISLTPDVVDCIVFWTKNPKPMIDRLDELSEYNYYFQFTLNSYGKDVETNVPSKQQEIVHTFKELSCKIGPERVIWRYDPILLNDTYTIDYHINYFEKIARTLKGYTQKCTISFIDLYRNTANNVKGLLLKVMTTEDKRKIAESFSEIAQKYDLFIDTCAEDIELEDINISHAHCIDSNLIEKIVGCKLNISKDKGQRLECGCVESVDIGTYNTCKNGCKYCYANFSQNMVNKNSCLHDSQSPLLFGSVSADDTITSRKVESCKIFQLDLF